MKILHIDKNHPLMLSQLSAQGFENEEDYTNTKEAIESKIADYDGIIIRSRFPIDKTFLDKATRLKFIGRVGAGLENIDGAYAESKGITLIAAPEGNRNAVGEHTLGMLLALLNKLKKANNEIKNGKWLREENRGWELDGKTIGIIGYGNMGKSFAKKLRGFDCNVICYDILPDKGDENAKQVTLVDFFRQADIVSLHTPQTPQTEKMINTAFINSFAKSFWFLNTARGKSVVTDDLVNALKNGKVLGAGLDVLEYEKASFEDFFSDGQMPESFKYLLDADNVILTPHIAGWTLESKEKLAQIIVDKIISQFRN
ncbi:2-hydroxyacid dehydrogenase [Capnocytophaga genosp. AHN8471]|uniref:2-hydroxyacid dehydrogenase n=1 Tax=Capnocytophaga genosp. AHN8471 TaxID=327574 RepID=UPI001932CF51|nr:2-hydroxyacid dehydrogenase [Capnocytophaga genosp. AHN8471]MBM0652344.1 2-hydroxyacid dehydrogenase [Capnocytophaga genosp. AHN8471]MBM0655116.1 2-hydroxyacid dehydrogenase [Capnocytophaga genosp. AHN8471]